MATANQNSGSIRGPLLIPRVDHSVDWIPDGEIHWEAGIITKIGPSAGGSQTERGRGIVIPPFLDLHTHIPQWPIRGHFCDGIDGCPDGGRLLAGLNRNVFPTEGKCESSSHAERVVASFAADTLAHGVVGGAAFMTVHPAATGIALHRLSDLWSVGLVLMNQNCPDYLRTDEINLERDVERLAGRFGRRLIVTDRFAVAVDSPLRQRAVKLAGRFGLRMQTHLNEQVAEKTLVEQSLYRGRGTYTEVYASDGLLGRSAILAHCIQMSAAEFDLVAGHDCAIAHCPTSNAALDSGVMPLDAVIDRGIPYAICTDVGASPTTSVLAEISIFMSAHAGRSDRATGVEALYRTTLGASTILGASDRVGDLSVGRPASFIEVEMGTDGTFADAESAVVAGLMRSPDRSRLRSVEEIAALVPGVAAKLNTAVRRVWMNGRLT